MKIPPCFIAGALVRLTCLLALFQAPLAVTAAYNLVWSDEFDLPNGSPPDPANWNYNIGTGNNGWGNNELQYYTSRTDNAQIQNGELVITILNEPNYQGSGKNYTSARLLTQGKHDWTYGRFEARIKLPTGGNGLWPAFWMLGSDIGSVGWPTCGEIDIMEYVSRLPNEIFGTIHGPGYSAGASYGNIYHFGFPVVNDYHIYAVEWEPNLIRWYVDGVLYHTATPQDVSPNAWVFDHDHFLILNVAVGGDFGGALDLSNLFFPTQMNVDYVRVYADDDLVIPPTPSIDVPAIVQAEEYTDQFGVQLETTSDTGGGLNAGYLDDGNYLEFLLNTPTAGRYAVDLRIASGATVTGRIVVSADGNSITSPDITNTGGWQSWITIPAGELDLPTGLVTLRLTMETPGIGIDAMNINWIEVSLVKADPMADPDRDGFINLFEEAYALDMFTPDPANKGALGALIESEGQTYLQISYRQLTGGIGTTGVDYIADGYTYAVEASSTLAPGSWQSAESLVSAIDSPVDNTDGSETVTVRALAPVTAGSRMFLRLKVTEEAP